jgi:hypothetical protein
MVWRRLEHQSFVKCKSRIHLSVIGTGSLFGLCNSRSGVFGVYGIAVDYRHLTILADYMVSSGRLFFSLYADTESTCVVDTRGRIQAIQPYRYRKQEFATAQGFL